MTRSEVRPLSSPKYLRMALVAPSGWGKTVFAGTARNALFLTTDPEGTASAKHFGSTAQEIMCSNQEHLQNAFLDLDPATGTLIKDLGLETVVVDNMTEVQAIFMQASTAARMSRPAKGDEPTDWRRQFVPDKQDYMVHQNALIEFVKKMITLPVNLIFTAHRKGREDEGGNDYYSVALQGKDGEVAEMILGYMNVIGMGEVVTIGEKEIRRIYFDHVGPNRGKDRFGELGRYRDNLDVPRMLSILYPTGQQQEVTSRPVRRPQRRV